MARHMESLMKIASGELVLILRVRRFDFSESQHFDCPCPQSSGARTALPMGVAPEIKLNCLQLRLNSIFFSRKARSRLGVKKRLDLLESRLALCDLLCVFSRFGLLYEFLQLVELTESWCTRMICSSSHSARGLT